jgi:hypothetical protein
MAIDITNLGRVNNYFKTVSGFVPNKYYITIGKGGNNKDINGNLSFYAKTVSLPQVKINTVNDIYVSTSSLAKPKLPISAESVGEISITFREDDRLSIYNKLVGYHNGIVGANYEATPNFENIIITIQIYNNSKVVFDRTYNKCSLFDLVQLKVDSSARKFLEYEAVFTCNDLSNSLTYDDPKPTLKDVNSSGIVSCNELQQKYQESIKKFKTYIIDKRYINPSSPKSTLNGQIGVDSLGLPVVSTFGNGETMEENSKYNAEIQVEYFMQYVKPAITSLQNNRCNIPPFPAIQGTFPSEDIYVKRMLRSEGFGV